MHKLIGTPEEQERELQSIFNKVFSTDDGKIVLNVLLNDLKFFSGCHSEGDNALRNYASFLISNRMGKSDTTLISDYIATMPIFREDFNEHSGKKSDNDIKLCELEV